MPGKCGYCIPALLLCLLLAGCSGQFLFRHIDWFVRDYVDDYVSLTDTQEEMLDDEVHQLQHWVIRHAIAQYIGFLDQLFNLNPGDITIEELARLQQQPLKFSRSLMYQGIPAATRLAATLAETQVQELLTSLHQQHQSLHRKYLLGTPRERRSKTTSRIEDYLEKWLGDLTPDQHSLVRMWADQRDVNVQNWQEWQDRVETEAQKLMALRKQPEQFKTRLDSLLQNTESYYPPRFRQMIEHNQRIGQLYLLQIIHQMTPKQTAHFRAEISDWKEMATEIQGSVITTR